MLRSPLRALLLATTVTFAASGCVSVRRSSPPPVASYAEVSDRLLFGRSIPGGGEVSDAEWDAFMRDVVTPAFPDGLTVLTGRGQWLGASGVVSREVSMVLEVVHAPDAASDAKIQRIADEYKRRFRQEAVMRVTTPAAMKFYE
jgi:hypothetical protein